LEKKRELRAVIVDTYAILARTLNSQKGVERLQKVV